MPEFLLDALPTTVKEGSARTGGLPVRAADHAAGERPRPDCPSVASCRA